MRMDPPPSFAWAIGTTPAATRAAEPPLEPPAVRRTSQGFAVAPYRVDSVLAVSPNSGIVVRATGASPSRSRCVTNGEDAAAGVSGSDHDPWVVA